LIDSRNKISFFTSFNSSNYGDQYKTWKKYAHVIYAIQDAKDKKMNVDCSIHLNKTFDVLGKKLHKISDIIKIARALEGNEKFVLVNSDIELNFSNETWNKICEKANDGLVVGQRSDYELDRKKTKKYSYGLDFFVINNKIKIEDAPFVMGSCAWDWWMVYLCRSQDIPVYSVDSEDSIYHKVHDRNWNDEMFLQSQIWFKQVTNIEKSSIKKELAEYIQKM
jgi:hypothetical protein